MKLESINFWFIVLRVSVSHYQLWIWEDVLFTLLRRLRSLLYLSSVQQKFFCNFQKKSNTKFFWLKNVGLFFCYWPTRFPSWYTDYWLYIVPPRVKPHCQLSSLHWSYRKRNTHVVLYKCGGVRRLKHGKSGRQIAALTGGTDLYFK